MIGTYWPCSGKWVQWGSQRRVCGRLTWWLGIGKGEEDKREEIFQRLAMFTEVLSDFYPRIWKPMSQAKCYLFLLEGVCRGKDALVCFGLGWEDKGFVTTTGIYQGGFRHIFQLLWGSICFICKTPSSQDCKKDQWVTEMRVCEMSNAINKYNTTGWVRGKLWRWVRNELAK